MRERTHIALLSLLYILSFANYNITMTVEYPYHYYVPDTSCSSCIKIDSVLKGNKVKIEIWGESYEKKVKRTGQNGSVNFIFEKWENGTDINITKLRV